MNGPTAGASAAVVIAKNPATGQGIVKGILLAGILTGDPLNNYLFLMRLWRRRQNSPMRTQYLALMSGMANRGLKLQMTSLLSG
jgi:hypothetical protein